MMGRRVSVIVISAAVIAAALGGGGVFLRNRQREREKEFAAAIREFDVSRAERAASGAPWAIRDAWDQVGRVRKALEQRDMQLTIATEHARAGRLRPALAALAPARKTRRDARSDGISGIFAENLLAGFRDMSRDDLAALFEEPMIFSVLADVPKVSPEALDGMLARLTGGAGAGTGSVESQCKLLRSFEMCPAGPLRPVVERHLAEQKGLLASSIERVGRELRVNQGRGSVQIYRGLKDLPLFLDRELTDRVAGFRNEVKGLATPWVYSTGQSPEVLGSLVGALEKRGYWQESASLGVAAGLALEIAESYREGDEVRYVGTSKGPGRSETRRPVTASVEVSLRRKSDGKGVLTSRGEGFKDVPVILIRGSLSRQDNIRQGALREAIADAAKRIAP